MTDNEVDQSRVNKVLSLLSEKKALHNGSVNPKQMRGTTRTRISLSPSDSHALHQCRPWSRPDFALRVCTFSPGTWFGKPLAVSPLVCARYGWINTKPDTIECSVCKAHLVFEISEDLEKEGADQAVTTFRKSLETGHQKDCQWVSKPCPTSFASFPESTPASLVGDFLDRVESMLPYPAIDHAITGVDDLDLGVSDEELYEGIQAQITDESSAILSADKSHVISVSKVALYGWDVALVEDGPRKRMRKASDTDVEEEIAYLCSVCQRRVASEAVSSSGLHPCNDHRSYCPWATAVRAEGQDDAGWKICLNAILAREDGGDGVEDGVGGSGVAALGKHLSNGDALTFVRQQLQLDNLTSAT